MDTKALRQKILDLAIRGKLVPQEQPVAADFTIRVLDLYDAAYESNGGEAAGFIWEGIRRLLQKGEQMYSMVLQSKRRE